MVLLSRAAAKGRTILSLLFRRQTVGQDNMLRNTALDYADDGFFFLPICFQFHCCIVLYRHNFSAHFIGIYTDNAIVFPAPNAGISIVCSAHSVILWGNYLFPSICAIKRKYAPFVADAYRYERHYCYRIVIL